MSAAIKSIVEGYFSLKDRAALEELRAHRQRLRKELHDMPRIGIDAGPAIRTLHEDLEVIEAAISRL